MLERNFPKIISFLIFLTFDLMLLGAGVRAMDAGLTCPDWPMCFGRAIPEWHLGVYLEFTHRMVAGFVAIIFMVCYIAVFRIQSLKPARWMMSISLFLLLAQIIMGGLTVLKLLAPGIVTMHLGLATAFLITLYLARAEVEDIPSSNVTDAKYRAGAALGLILICVQILLGGWVASNYAGAVCVDFPTCNGQWFPAWTGPIGAQVIHRLGAYTLGVFFTVYFIYALILFSRRQITAVDKQFAAQAFVLVLSQMMIGILNLKFLVPVWLTVVHLGIALYLMQTLLKLNIRLFRS